MIVHRFDTKTRQRVYGIEGVDVANGRQLYPYDTLSEAQATQRLIELNRNPKDPRFVDPAYVAVLKQLDRI